MCFVETIVIMVADNYHRETDQMYQELQSLRSTLVNRRRPRVSRMTLRKLFSSQQFVTAVTTAITYFFREFWIHEFWQLPAREGSQRPKTNLQHPRTIFQLFYYLWNEKLSLL